MTWADFYLGCFAFGFLLSLVSFVFGSLHLHLPGLHHGPHFHLHAGSHFGGHGVGHGGGAAHGGANVAAPGADTSVSPINFGTVAAFLAWFGGAGYLLTRYSGFWALTALSFAIAAGVLGAAIVFWFLAKVLLAHEKNLDPADYDRIGVIGRVSVPIREGGTGEIIFSQEGTRHTCGARSESDAIPRGSEVVITRYEKGIAYVRLWEELANPERPSPQARSAEKNG
jgi:membrane protein implicated in regulation of membrane protease activity